MTLTVLILADPGDKTLALLDAVDGDVAFVVGSRLEAFAAAAPRADALLVWSSDRATAEQVFAAAPRLRWVHSWAAGVDWLLFPALVERDVVVTNTRGVYGDSLAEFALGAMLYFAKDFARMKASQRARRWDPFDVQMLRGATLGVCGYGDIGRRVAALGAAMGMEVLALRRHPSPDGPEMVPSKRVLCERSDYLVLAAPITPETRHMIGADELDAMRPGAVLINVGRGALVDQNALVRALQRGTLRGAALDVFETEPLPADDPLYALDNVLLSPHTADHTATWREEAMRCFLENLRRWRAGEPLLHVVDKARGY
ncbi:MAG TPA: D-2-hydroxyacid dehydrogenase [Polyangiaceae bacterium]|jgi:phosphoglycerate dehydrogenase-like enzyme